MAERISSIGEIERNFKVTDTVDVVVKTRGFNTWCRAPYPDHPHGCPNFGINEDCPPRAKYFLDIYKPQIKIAALTFDFGEYLRLRREKHPNWTERQLRNPWYFQGHLDANLKRFTDNLNIPGFTPEYSPEAMGVNVHMTCLRTGIRLEWPPRKIMHRIAILAQPINTQTTNT